MSLHFKNSLYSISSKKKYDDTKKKLKNFNVYWTGKKHHIPKSFGNT